MRNGESGVNNGSGLETSAGDSPSQSILNDLDNGGLE
jgi:hypothetical protein